MKIEIAASSLREMRAIARGLDDAGKTIAVAQTRAINRVAAKTMTRARRAITSQVRLSASYVRERMTLQNATLAKPGATISARQRPTRLATYGASQLTRAASDASGDPLRGIPAGRKQAGISVGVKKGGARKKMRGAFLMPLRAGNVGGGNGMGVFIRTGPARRDVKHLYSPSVDQLFNGVAEALVPTIETELEAALLRQIQHEVDKAMNR